MPLHLHVKLKEHLISAVATALDAMFIDDDSLLIKRDSGASELLVAERVLPQAGKVRDALVEYIDDFPLVHFIQETLNIELHARNDVMSFRDGPFTRSRPRPIKLTDIPGYGSVGDVAARLAVPA